MKVSEYLAEWLKLQETNLQRSTYESWTIYISKHLIPYFDSIGAELKTLTPMQIQHYVYTKLKSGRLDGKNGGLSVASVRKHLAILKQALNDAVLYEYIDRNPASHVKTPRVRENIAERTVMLDMDTARRVLKALKGEKIYPLVYIALIYGLRKSEVLGLRWDAIDFISNTMQIKHTVVKASTIQAKDSTKTLSSHQKYPLLPEVAQMLAGLRDNASKGSVYVFERADGTPMRPDSVTRSFQRALKRHGFEKMRFHDLRHSACSILFDMGWNLEDVKCWMRHSDIETTSNIYMHYKRDRTLRLGEKLTGIFAV